jgi:hypothetical protein
MFERNFVLPILSGILRESRYNLPKAQVIQNLTKQAITFTHSSGSTGFEICIPNPAEWACC